MSNFKWSRSEMTGGSEITILTTLPWTFEETVGRLMTLTGQRGTSTEQYKISVEFRGTWRGMPFYLYDYKEDKCIHLGGRTGNLYTNRRLFEEELGAELNLVTPTPFRKKTFYHGRKRYSWPPETPDTDKITMYRSRDDGKFYLEVDQPSCFDEIKLPRKITLTPKQLEGYSDILEMLLNAKQAKVTN